MRDKTLLLVVEIGVVAVVALLAQDLAQACAVCLGSSANDPFSRGLTWGILFLAAMPFTIVGSIGGWLLYQYRRRPKVVRRGSLQAGGQPAPTSKTSAPARKESWK